MGACTKSRNKRAETVVTREQKKRKEYNMKEKRVQQQQQMLHDSSTARSVVRDTARTLKHGALDPIESRPFVSGHIALTGCIEIGENTIKVVFSFGVSRNVSTRLRLRVCRLCILRGRVRVTGVRVGRGKVVR